MIFAHFLIFLGSVPKACKNMVGQRTPAHELVLEITVTRTLLDIPVLRNCKFRARNPYLSSWLALRV